MFITPFLWRTAGAVAILTVAQAALASPVVFYDSIGDGRTQFDTTITGVGGTVQTDTLTGLTNNAASWDRGSYAITATNGVNRSVVANYFTFFPVSGPTGDGINGNASTNPTTAVDSGLTFTFDSPINAFAVEIGDWATCCYPTSLYIQFDAGSPILIGTANSSSGNPGVADNGEFVTFVGAIDDSGTFQVVKVYGVSTAGTDVLYFGGTIRFAIIPIGAISNPSPPAPLVPDESDVFGVTTAAAITDRLGDFEMQRLLQHLNDLRSGRGPTLADAAPKQVASIGDFWPNFDTKRIEPFAIVRFVDADIASGMNRLSSNLQAFGATLGFDFAVTNDLILGLAGSYSRGHNKAKNNAAKDDVESVGVAGFASWQIVDGLVFDAAAGAYWLDHDLRRSELLGNVTADPKAKTYTAQTRLSYHLNKIANLGLPIDLVPFAALYWAHGSTEAYTESGLGAISVDRDTQETLLGEVGASIYHEFVLAGPFAEDTALVPQLDVSYNRHLRDDDRIIAARLAGETGVFPVQVAAEDDDFVRIRPSIGIWIGDDMSLNLSYETLLANEDFDSYHEARLEFKIRL